MQEHKKASVVALRMQMVKSVVTRAFKKKSDSKTTGQAGTHDPEDIPHEMDVDEDVEQAHSARPERLSLLSRLHTGLQQTLLSFGWEVFMSSSILLYSAGMGAADIDVKWKDESWKADLDQIAFLCSFLVSLLEALLKMIAFGLGLFKKRADGRVNKLPHLSLNQVYHTIYVCRGTHCSLLQ